MVSTVTKTPLPPIVQGEPILGSLRPFLQRPIDYLYESYQEIGPIYRMRMLNREYTVMAGMDVKDFLREHDNDVLSNGDTYNLQNAELGAVRSMTSASDAEHSHMRKHFSPGYRKSAISDHVRWMHDAACEILNDIPQGKSVNIMDVMQRIVFRQLGVSLTNHDPAEYFEDVRFWMNRMLSVAITKRLPKILLQMPDYKRSRRRVIELAELMLREEDGVPNKFAQLVKSYEPLEGEATHGDRLLAVLSPYIAGIDTVASTATFLTYAYLAYEDVRTRVDEETRHHFTAESVPGVREIGKLPIISATVSETLRLYPVAPTALRYVEKPFDFKGYRVEQGSTVMAFFAATHFDPAYFSAPHTFDIDRFMKPRSEHRQTPGALTPYSVGPHTCLGAGIAEAQLGIILAALASAPGLKLADPDYEMRVKIDPLPVPAEPLMVLR